MATIQDSKRVDDKQKFGVSGLGLKSATALGEALVEMFPKDGTPYPDLQMMMMSFVAGWLRGRGFATEETSVSVGLVGQSFRVKVRGVLAEHYRKEIAASTETLALRERVRTLDGRLRVLANHGCPPGLYSTDGCRKEGCAPCWREWGLG